jgi:hypothetical protein
MQCAISCGCIFCSSDGSRVARLTETWHSKIWSCVPWYSQPRLTVLARSSSNYHTGWMIARWLRLAPSNGPTSSAEDGNTINFWHIVFLMFFRILDDGQKYENLVIAKVIHHYQNPLESQKLYLENTCNPIWSTLYSCSCETWNFIKINTEV